MTRTLRATAFGTLLALGGALALLCAPGAHAEGATPLSPSNYSVRAACQPPAPGFASCLALQLLATTPAARAQATPLGTGTTGGGGAVETAAGKGYTPQDLRHAYFPNEAPDAPASEPQTIALVDAYNDFNAKADLEVYDEEFKLPACAAGCFEQVNQNGGSELPFPKEKTAAELEQAKCTGGDSAACTRVREAGGWALEISTDIEMAHAICQNCKILLVEANSALYADLEAAEDTAVRLGAGELSNSWGGAEAGDSPAFNHPGTVITAAAGDYGYLNWTIAAEAEAFGEPYYQGADYPAVSPHVIAVGATKLELSGGVRQSETAWNEDPSENGQNHGAGGGGCSAELEAPKWQRRVPDWSSVGCEGLRASADIAADGDPYTGVAVYDSVADEGTVPHWTPVGGTSVASPIIASMFALAGGAHGVEYPARSLYAHLGSSALYDVTAGGNGNCHGVYTNGCSGSMNPKSALFHLDCGQGVLICNAAPGYDGPTGVGTPNSLAAFAPSNEPEPQEGVHEQGNAEVSQSSASSAPKPPDGHVVALTSAPTPPPVRLSGLALTLKALIALNASHARISQVSFAFQLNEAARVRVSLTKRVSAHRHTHWQKLSSPITITAAGGRNSRRLSGRRVLTAGVYRLTLTPPGGSARSITFQIG